jgi:cytoskeletal protein CcmA (bactofilin family)
MINLLILTFQGLTMAKPNIRNSSYQIVDTTVGSSSMLVGVLNSDGNINIEGVFEGEIASAQHVGISTAGRVRAIINAISCTINGSLVGNIHATDAVIIQPSARVWGEIDAPTLQIEPGAVFKGVANGTNDADDMFKR